MSRSFKALGCDVKVNSSQLRQLVPVSPTKGEAKTSLLKDLTGFSPSDRVHFLLNYSHLSFADATNQQLRKMILQHAYSSLPAMLVLFNKTTELSKSLSCADIVKLLAKHFPAIMLLNRHDITAVNNYLQSNVFPATGYRQPAVSDHHQGISPDMFFNYLLQLANRDDKRTLRELIAYARSSQSSSPSYATVTGTLQGHSGPSTPSLPCSPATCQGHQHPASAPRDISPSDRSSPSIESYRRSADELDDFDYFSDEDENHSDSDHSEEEDQGNNHNEQGSVYHALFTLDDLLDEPQEDQPAQLISPRA